MNKIIVNQKMTLFSPSLFICFGWESRLGEFSRDQRTMCGG